MLSFAENVSSSEKMHGASGQGLDWTGQCELLRQVFGSFTWHADEPAMPLLGVIVLIVFWTLLCREDAGRPRLACRSMEKQRWWGRSSFPPCSRSLDRQSARSHTTIAPSSSLLPQGMHKRKYYRRKFSQCGLRLPRLARGAFIGVEVTCLYAEEGECGSYARRSSLGTDKK